MKIYTLAFTEKEKNEDLMAVDIKGLPNRDQLGDIAKQLLDAFLHREVERSVEQAELPLEEPCEE